MRRLCSSISRLPTPWVCAACHHLPRCWWVREWLSLSRRGHAGGGIHHHCHRPSGKRPRRLEVRHADRRNEKWHPRSGHRPECRTGTATRCLCRAALGRWAMPRAVSRSPRTTADPSARQDDNARGIRSGRVCSKYEEPFEPSLSLLGHSPGAARQNSAFKQNQLFD